MKTNNKDEIRALKSKHRLELVMQETGESFTVDSSDTNQWRSIRTPGLVVDITRQSYKISKPGMDPEAGDVIAWLQSRYNWTFNQAIKYLEARAPDPDLRALHPAEVESQNQQIYHAEDKQPLDRWQKKALKIGGDEVRKYFSNTWYEIFQLMGNLPTQFMPIIAIDIDECSECGDHFNWEDPKTTAYLFQGSDFNGEDMPLDERNKFILDIYIEGVICESCKRKKISFYQALSYCGHSARQRAKAETEPTLE